MVATSNAQRLMSGDNDLLDIVPDAIVPCDTCILYCQGAHVLILDKDAEEFDYKLTTTTTSDGTIQRHLQRHANGDCIYLADNKCSIYENRPRVCRKFSCVGLIENLTRNRRRQLLKDGDVTKEIIARGRKLYGKPTT